jgi:hypothetical protein
MELSISNLNKPSNKAWKKVADYLLYTLPLYSSAIAIGADNLWNAKVALVITVVINVLIVTLKGLTKFTAEDPAPTPTAIDNRV